MIRYWPILTSTMSLTVTSKWHSKLMKKVDIDVKFVNFYGSLEGGDDIYRQRLKF